MENGCWDRFQTCLLYDACNCLFKGSCMNCFSAMLSILLEINEDRMLNYCHSPLRCPEMSCTDFKVSIILWLESSWDTESFVSLEELAFFMLFSLVSPQILSRQEKKKLALQNCLWIPRVSYVLKAVCSHATFESLRKGGFERYRHRYRYKYVFIQ